MQMIHRLRRNFILLASAAVFLLVFIVLLLVNVSNYVQTMDDIDSDLHYIASHGGVIPVKTAPAERGWFSTGERGNNTDEFSYQTRFFSVLADKEGNIKNVNTKNTASFSDAEAVEYARTSVSSGNAEGIFEKDKAFYAYLITTDEKENRLIVIMDCTREFAFIHALWRFSGILGIFCIIVYIAVFAILSKWVMRPFVDNMESQKRFITNAGHELKTPIAIISANAEAIEMINGKNQWTESILKQVKRQTDLINRLVALSRIGEYGSDEAQKREVDVTETVRTVIDSFRPVAEEQQKNIQSTVDKNIKVFAIQRSIYELTNILVDNAVKYCDDKGTIYISLKAKKRRKKNFALTVANDFTAGKGVDYSRFFERFYRGDESHNSEKSGFGIGLSMAEEFARSMKGVLTVTWRDGVIFFTVTV